MCVDNTNIRCTSQYFESMHVFRLSLARFCMLMVRYIGQLKMANYINSNLRSVNYILAH